MASKSAIIKSLKSQGLVSNPESWVKLVVLIACVSKSSKPLDDAVYECYQKIK